MYFKFDLKAEALITQPTKRNENRKRVTLLSHCKQTPHLGVYYLAKWLPIQHVIFQSLN